jgi:hypothetical protein
MVRTDNRQQDYPRTFWLSSFVSFGLILRRLCFLHGIERNRTAPMMPNSVNQTEHVLVLLLCSKTCHVLSKTIHVLQIIEQSQSEWSWSYRGARRKEKLANHACDLTWLQLMMHLVLCSQLACICHTKGRPVLEVMWFELSYESSMTMPVNG